MPLFTPRRIPVHELLDEHDAPRDDMERSLRDLRWINRWLGGTAIYRRLLRRVPAAKSVVDLGAGTCDDLESLRGVRLRVGLDFKIDHLLYLREGSSVHRVVGNACLLPFRDGAVDVVSSAHFFHHFSPEENAVILGESVRVARRAVVVNDTRRHYVPLLVVLFFSAIRVFGRITRSDAPASVRQGYTLAEARAIVERVPAARCKVVRAFPYRFGILLWKT